MTKRRGTNKSEMSTNVCRLGISLLWSLVVCSAAGCGSPNAAKVSGQVTLDDQPLTSGTVTFHPESGTGAVAYGQIDGQGRYELSTGSDAGLAPGAYVATVLATEEIPARRPNEESTFKPITPARYNSTESSGLKFDVKAGRNNLPLPLTSK